MSDHDAVICDINLRANPPANPKWNVYLYKRADMEGLRRKLKERFELFEASRPETKSIRENWDHLKADIYNSINEFIPKRTLKNKRSPPWCNANIRRLIRKKQRCYNPARRNGKEQVWRRFRHLRKLVHKELQLAHQQYVNSLLDIDEADPIHDHAKAGIIKLFWQYIKAKRRDSAGIAILKSHGKEFTKPKKKADILNEQYDSVFTLEDPVLPQLPDSPYPDMPNIHIDNNGVIKLLSGLNPSKANGPDLLPTCVLKEEATEIAPYLSFVFQQSINTGEVPPDWKHANVVAIFKKGSRSEAANYRPVFLTSLPCKLLEHIIYRSIMIHLNSFDILVDAQHGFRPGRSCETQLINTLEHLARPGQ